MSRPQIIVNVTQAIARRGVATETGTAFMAYAAATGTPAGVPVECLSADAAVAATVPAAVAAWVGDALGQGAHRVIVVRAAAVDPAAVTQPEWQTALASLSAAYGAGQVLIPGVSSPAAHGALLAHAASTGRVALLDAPKDAAASATVTTAAGLAAASGAERSGLIAPWVTIPGVSAPREVPGSVIAAGLSARGDAVAGHANHAPAGLHSGGAGVVQGGTGVTKSFTDAELDSLHDAGVSVIRMINGTPTLYGWRSLSDDPVFRQLSVGRMAMQLSVGLRGVAEQFLFEQIDGRGHLFAEFEGALRGYLLPLWVSDALYGDNATDSFDVEVRSANTPATIAAGELHATVQVRLTPHTELVTIKVVTSIAEGA